MNKNPSSAKALFGDTMCFHKYCVFGELLKVLKDAIVFQNHNNNLIYIYIYICIWPQAFARTFNVHTPLKIFIIMIFCTSNLWT